jgi:eukaryotic-like serine/threonine-protein kinase
VAFLPWQPKEYVGPYELTRMVASGGMAEVWEARLDGPVGFAKRVAIKRLMASVSEEKHVVGMFLDEARLMAGLSHPHICQVIELGERDGSYWVAMEFLAGQSAYQVMRESGVRGLRLPTELCVLIGRDVAEALTYVHEKSDENGKPLAIIHRDVSPQNVMITYEGVVKLVDFGIAKAASRTTITEEGQMRGKMAYMPPEQARGEAMDGRADQFSLGTTLFELLTQTRVYGPLKEMDLFREVAVNTAPLPSIRSRLPELPEALDALISKMMERDPANRFATMSEVHEKLANYLTENTQSLPGSAALALYMSNCFPPESRHRFLSQSGTPSLRGRSKRAAPMRRWPFATGLAVVGALTGAFLWTRCSSEPEQLPVAPSKAVVPDAPSATIAQAPPEPPPAVPGDHEHEIDLASLPNTTTEAPTKPAVKRLTKGFLSLQTTPWTLVFLGNKSLGETPMVNVPLPPGMHRLKLVNEEKKLSTTIEVEIKPGQTTTKRLKF